MEVSMDDRNILHGNNARIDGKRNVVPRFINYVANDFISRSQAEYDRFDDGVEFCKKEVDDNQK
jgi:hypothetical protein